MAVEANSNLLPQEFSDFIPLGMENCRDFMSTKPRLAAYQRIFPFNRSRPVKNVVAGNSLQQPSLHGKRSRDSLDLYSHPSTQIGGGGDDFLQSEIDRIVAHHTKKLRIEFEERQKLPSRNSMAAIGEGLVKKLREKDEEIQRMGKLNLALQERVKSLYVENQLWRDMAHVADERVSVPAAVAAVEEDAESCCGSSDHGRGEPEVCTAMPEWRTLRRRRRIARTPAAGCVAGAARESRVCCCCRVGISASAQCVGPL
nr:probable BOI-related E3 ubiquitin-protein ligase 3 [Ipomoea batatas]